MTVRATERPNQLINDLIALRDAERVVCRMSHEEIMRCMQLGLHDDERGEYYDMDYDEILEEDACYARLPLGIRPCEDGAELVPKEKGIPGLQLRIETESFVSQRYYEATVDACYWDDGVEAVFSTDENKELLASSEVAAAMLVARSDTHTLSVIQGIAGRILKALF